MKTTFSIFAAVICVLSLDASHASGQTSGDFRSSGSGNWNAAATWQSFDGSVWNPAVNPPDGTSGTITIQSGHTVTVPAGKPDTINGAAIVVNGYLRDSAYINFVTGTMAVNNGATYEFAHPSSSGQGIPKATWNTGSTCLLTGITSSTTGLNGNQPFYNLTVNCPSWSGSLNFGWNTATPGGSTNIAGNVTVMNTGTGRWQFCAPQAGVSDTVNIGGNLIIDGSSSSASALVGVTSNGTSNGSTTVIINIAGNVNVTGNPAVRSWTNFSVSRGSQGATGTTTWNLYGNSFSMSNAATQNSNPTGAKFVFAKAGKQTMTLSGDSVVACPVRVLNGTTLSMGTSVLGGSGTFTLD